MLKINSYTNKKIENIFSDAYIPLDIRFGSEKSYNDHLSYWRCGDEQNIIEIGILKNSKELYSVTLVSISNIILQKYTFSSRIDISKYNCPLFDIECLDNYYTSEESTVKIYVGNDDVTVFFNNDKTTKHIKNDGFIFFLDKNNNWIGFNMKTNNKCHNNLIKQYKG